MATIHCPSCGAGYDLAVAAQHGRFTCARCKNIVTVNVTAAAAPSPVAPPAQPAPAPVVAAAQAGRKAKKKGRRGRRPPRERERNTNAMAWVAVTALLLGGAIASFQVLGNESKTGAPVDRAASGSAATTTAERAAVTADIDPAAWKRLPAAERKTRVDGLVMGVDLERRGAVNWAIQFLTERGEDEAAQKVGRDYLAIYPHSVWVPKLLGYREVREEINRVLDNSPSVDDTNAAVLRELNDLILAKAPDTDTWWASPTVTKQVDALLERIVAEEKRLGDGHSYAVARWVNYQRTIPGMRDLPSIHGTQGPYLVFAQVRAKPGTQLEEVDAGALLEAKTALRTHLELFNRFYDDFLEHMGPLLSLSRFDETKTDHATLMKANVFPDSKAYDAYNRQTGVNSFFTRAYYSTEEPRFICTYVDDKASMLEERQVQFHEAVHQVMHLYTWYKTRQVTQNENLSWLECMVRPAWSAEGFAEFFSGCNEVNQKYIWMHPLRDRIKDAWICGELVRRKGWGDISLAEMLSIRTTHELSRRVRKRVDPPFTQLAQAMYQSLFYARAWSLVYFLWNHQEGGKPKYRDAYIRYLRYEMIVRYDKDAAGNPIKPHQIDAHDFRRTMGLLDDADFRAFEKELRAYEQELVKKHERPGWRLDRQVMLLTFGITPTKGK